MIDRFFDFKLEGFATRTVREAMPLVVVFWRVDCEPCEKALPYFEKLSAAYSRAIVVGVTADTHTIIDPWCRAKEIEFRQLFDPEGAVARRFRIDTMPSFLLTDLTGNLLVTCFGWDRELFEAVSRRVAELTNAPYVSIADTAPAFMPGASTR